MLSRLKSFILKKLLGDFSTFFDFETYSDAVGLSGFWAKKPLLLLHYLLIQNDPLVQCCPIFDPHFFKQQCVNAGLPAPKKPLMAYISDKRYWDINPHPLFDAKYYYGQLNTEISQSPLHHYIQGGHCTFDPHPLFSRKWYVLSYPMLHGKISHCTLSHYIKIGSKTQAHPHPLFDSNFYSENANINKSKSSKTDPLQHFIESQSDLSPHPLFSPSHFAHSINVKNIFSNDLLITHYLLNKSNWNKSTHLLFDGPYYQQQLDENADIPLLEHYLTIGYTDINPHPLFHTEWYLGRKQKLLSLNGLGKVPLCHYLDKGHFQGESPHPLFSTQWYRLTYHDGKKTKTDPLSSFLTEEESLGYRPNALFPENWQALILEQTGCNNLIEYAKKTPIPLPSIRNRLNDIFTVPYLVPRKNKPVEKITKNYLILFTARSGSSWLTDLLTATQNLGKPGEWVNPNLMLSASNYFQSECHSLEEYFHELTNTHCTENLVFGMETTANQLQMIQETLDTNKVFENPKYVVHIRKNIVAQAISLYLATESGFFHANNRINEGNSVKYNKKRIKHWIRSIFNSEVTFHSYLLDNKCDYHLSFYEDLKENPNNTVIQISNYLLDENTPITFENESSHKKIGSTINEEYEALFRKQHPLYLKKIEGRRPFTNLG